MLLKNAHFRKVKKLTGQAVGDFNLIEDGDRIAALTADDSFRFLLISGKPIGEPVAWQGPIVMNTREELDLAFQEYRDGSFIKHGAGSP